MSKARAKARRQQKQGARSHNGGRTLWVWLAAIGLPLLIVGAFFYRLNRPPVSAVVETAIVATVPPEPAAVGSAVPAAGNSDATESAALSAPTRPTLPLGPADYCRRHPRFARQMGFNERAILTTSSPTIKGLAMIQPAEADNPEQVYQDPTWDDAGYLGHMTFDPTGNVYLFPSPRVSLIDNPPQQQNTLYRVDSDSAQMTSLITLTADSPPTAANPYGIMGTTYDCDTNSLYVSTVAGSTATEEVGKIVRIDLTSEAVVAELQGIDPFGLSVLNLLTEEQGATEKAVGKRLYFGAARNAEVYSILLDDQGGFVGQPALELALPNTSLKPWRIVWDTNGDLIVRAMPFDFNLIATSERIEIPFRFRRDEAGLWQYVAE